MMTYALTQDKTFMNAISNAASLEELQSIFSDYGIEVSIEELKATIRQIAAEQGEDLNEDALEAVSGGIAVTTCYMILNGCMIAMAGKPLWQLACLVKGY